MTSKVRCQRQIHISLIVRQQSVAWWSTNLPKTHPRIKRLPYKQAIDHTHSELAVIIKAGIEEFSGYDLYVLRFAKGDGELAYSKPCKGCQEAIKQANFDNVWFSNDKGEFERWQ